MTWSSNHDRPLKVMKSKVKRMLRRMSILQSPISNLQSIPTRGLWPYTADPAETGLLEIGSPPPGPPLIVEGNSRHALGRLQRALEGIGGRVLVLETGGRDLYMAATAGVLTQEVILDALPPHSEERTATGEASARVDVGEDGSAPASQVNAVALLPFPLWQSLDAETLSGAGIVAGPATPEHLPGFLWTGELSEVMKVRRTPLRERLHHSLAHAMLLLLVASAPLLFVGLEALLIAIGVALAAALGAAVLLPQLQTRLASYDKRLALLAYGTLFGLLVGVAPLVMGVAVIRVVMLVGVGVVMGVWLGWLDGVRGPIITYETNEH